MLTILSVLNFVNVKQFQAQFNTLQQANTQRLGFMAINRDILELQRLALVYSYVGYTGVLHKITRQNEQLDKELELAKSLTKDNKRIHERLITMATAYKEYDQLFSKSVAMQKTLKQLQQGEIETLHLTQNQILQKLTTSFANRQQLEQSNTTNEITLALTKIYADSKIISTSANIVLFGNTLARLKSVQEMVTTAKTKTTTANQSELLNMLATSLKKYDDALKKLVTTRSSFLQLINVVLAGKTAQINQLSQELDQLIEQHAQTLRQDITDGMNRAQNRFHFFTVLAVLTGLASSILIATGIASPVKAISKTLSKLAEGEANIDIPGQQRQDELGSMAKAANEFKLMAQNLEAQTAELEEFAYRTSHDLRSPLVASLSLLELATNALEKDDKQQAQQAIDFTHNSLSKLEKLVRDILDLTKTKAAQENKTEIDLDTIINETIAKIANLPNFQRLDIQVAIDPSITLHSQKSRITLILENLISNAVKYQNTDTEASYIKVHALQHKSNIVIEVEDNGLGIPEKYQHQLFTMFKRFHPNASFGSGLGLYMVKKSAEVINAKLEYESREQGSTFRLILPVTQDEQTTD
ncbi:ATP-binding protein [Spongiibacter sp. IMCC21906]|uniref:sensor histidine kinase n=1 Tax=Spongiibacter sp. IMCC21906 TaxID=1620392 RepID=UPI0018CE296D|nr:HAMP domain-containing sensor histidine kinase [Spongiibacter sp. IMCC21906]